MTSNQQRRRSLRLCQTGIPGGSCGAACLTTYGTLLSSQKTPALSTPAIFRSGRR